MAAALLPDPLRDLVEPFLPIPTRQPKGGRPRVSGSEGPPEPRADQIAIDWTDCQLRSETPEARRVDAVFVSHALALRRHAARAERSEEHTSELQSLAYLVCRLLLEKKK